MYETHNIQIMRCARTAFPLSLAIVYFSYFISLPTFPLLRWKVPSFILQSSLFHFHLHLQRLAKSSTVLYIPPFDTYRITWRFNFSPLVGMNYSFVAGGRTSRFQVLSRYIIQVCTASTSATLQVRSCR